MAFSWKELHLHQSIGVESLVHAAQFYQLLAAIWATGSGKTVLTREFIRRTRGILFSHVIIAAPAVNICHGFRRELIPLGAKITESWHDLKVYINSHPDLAQEEIRICCHASINDQIAAQELNLFLDLNPSLLRGKLLVIDEAHHAGAKGLASFIEVWRKGGGHVFYLTATPYRTDTEIAIPLESYFIYRTMCQQMKEGFAPARLLSEITDVGGLSTPVEGVYGAPEFDSIDRTAKSMVDAWEKDGRPYLTIRVKNPSDSDYNKSVMNSLMDEFSRRGARVLNAYGEDGGERLQALLSCTDQAIEAVRNGEDPATAKSIITHDVIIGIQRVAEGMDWPICSHVYLWGIPKSLPIIIQILGRAMRQKDMLSSEAWRDTSKLVIFTAGVNPLAHSRHTLLTAYLLSDYSSPKDQMSVFQEIHGLIDGLPGPMRFKSMGQMGVCIIIPEVKAAVQSLIDQVKQQVTNSDPLDSKSLTGKQVLDLISQDLIRDFPFQVTEEAVKTIIMEHMASKNEHMKESFREEIQKGLVLGKDISEILKEAVEAVLDKFRDETIDKTSLLNCQVHDLDGNKIELHADELRIHISSLSEEDMYSGFDKFAATQGRFPNFDDRNPVNAIHTFGSYDRALRRGSRNLPQKSGGLGQAFHDRHWNEPRKIKNWAILLQKVQKALSETFMDSERYIRDTAFKLNCPTLYYFPNAYRAAKYLSENELLCIGIESVEAFSYMSDTRMKKCAKQLSKCQTPEEAKIFLENVNTRSKAQKSNDGESETSLS